MFLKLIFLAFCIGFSFLGIRSQRVWDSSNSGYDSRPSNSWNSNNGYSFNKPSTANINNAGSWGSDFLSIDKRPNEKLPSSGNEKNFNVGYETVSNTGELSGWNSNQLGENNRENFWQQNDFNKRPNEKKLSSIMNSPDSDIWNANSNRIPSNSEKENNLGSTSWGNNYNQPFSGQINSQISRPNDWESNSLKPNKNVAPSESNYEDNPLYSSWNSNNKKKPKPTSSYNREKNTEKNNNSGNSKWETNNNNKKNNKKHQNLSGSNTWNLSQNEKEKNSTKLDTSILDELDQNDWYFGKESNFPKPPLRSVNIDVSELWNFDKNRKSSQSNNNKNHNRRRNRQIDRLQQEMNIQCECVNVNNCEEKDMIITKEDIKFDLRQLEEFMCDDLTEVCCTNPKVEDSIDESLLEEKEPLRCGQRRVGENLFENLGDKIAEPGEFPWNLRLINAEINCSASLIHHKMALTAAHCVTGTQPDELLLQAGVWNSNNEPFQNRNVAKVIQHPEYNSLKPRNDIALLVLETPFELTDNVNTICLPVTNDKWDSNECVVAGWKREEIRGQVIEILEKEVVNFLPQTECQNIMLVTDLWRNYILHDSFVCGLEKTEQKSCKANEGGFVICPSKKRPKTYLQVGIVSKGMNCDNFGRPGIFTNVLKYLDWINKNYFELKLFDDIDVRSLQ